MPARMKVFGGRVFRGGKQVRVLVATTSQKKVAEIVGESLNSVRDFWPVTGNAAEIDAAMARPGEIVISPRERAHDI